MEILGKILGSTARVKLMRLFLLNRENIFSNKEIVKRSRVNPNVVSRELKILHSVGFLKKQVSGWSFNHLFKYGQEFERLLINSDTIDKEAILSNLKKTGKLKLLLVSGLFIKNPDSRVDLFLVGDRLKRGKIEEEIRKLEAEIGKELSYTVFDTKEFAYRLNMYDKLVRDILDFPHEVIFQAKELSTQTLKKT